MPDNVYVPRRRSLAGPVVLIVLGVLFLLGNMRVITWANIGHYFARYWPALLILWGVIKLVEYYRARQQGYTAAGIGASGVLLVIFLVILGVSATTADRVNWNALRGEVDIDDDFAGFFGKTFNFDDQLEQEFPASGSLRVISDRGSVTVNAWEENRIKVVVHKKVVAENDSAAEKANTGTKPEITVAGDMVTVNANVSGSGSALVQTNMEIFVPRKAALDVSTRRGDVTARQRQGDVKVSGSRGDVIVEDLTGNLNVTMRRGDVRAVRVSGDVLVEGRVNDISVSEVGGSVRLSGDFFGDINVGRVAKAVSFKSARTDLEFGKLSGDMNMQSGDLRVKSLAGPVRIMTRSKDIHLDEVSGDVTLENTNGVIEVHSTLPLGRIEISNRKGDVQVVLPAKSAFQADLRTRRGDIQSEFPSLTVENDRHESKASGTVGSGGPRVQINSEYGNIEIRKAS